MKKIIVLFFAAVFTAMSLNAQTVSVDSVFNTSVASSLRVRLGFSNNSSDLYFRVQFGPNGNVNEFWTVGYFLSAGSDTMSVFVDNLALNTSYSLEGCIYYPVQICSSVVTFATPACSLNVAISIDSVNSCSKKLNATTGFISYQWELEGVNISGATSNSYVASNSGNYKVVVSNATCEASSSAVVVDVTPIIVTACADITICEGGSTTLTVTGTTGASYVWSDGSTGASVSVNPSISKTYTVTASLNGCTNTDQVQVKVNQLPNVSVTVSQDTMCVNANTNFAFTATSGSSLSGSNALNGNSMDPSVAGPGKFTIVATLTDANGCVNTDDVVVNVLIPDTVISASSVGGTLIINGSFHNLIEIEYGGVIYNTDNQNSSVAIFQNVPPIEVGDMLIVQTVGGEGCFIMTTYSSVVEILLGDNVVKDRDTRIFDVTGRFILDGKEVSDRASLMNLLSNGIYIQGGKKFEVIK